MFENSLVVSQVNRTSSTQRWTAFASMGLQFAIASLVIALPLLHPERLAFQMNSPHLIMPLPAKPPIPVEHVQTSSTSSSMAVPVAESSHPVASLLPHPYDDAPSLSDIPFTMRATDGIPQVTGIGDASHGPHIAVVATHPSSRTVRISSGVSAGMLLAPIRPVYPNIARIARVEGTVVVEAIISRTGTIDSLHVVSGPVMLQQAALDAIRSARYQPYRLNGSPTEVQTTIAVNFRLGN